MWYIKKLGSEEPLDGKEDGKELKNQGNIFVINHQFTR